MDLSIKISSLQTRDELFGTGDRGESILEYKGIQTLNAKVYKELPRLRASRPPAGNIRQIF